MSDPEPTAALTGLPDLAAARLGGAVLEASDEFFAPKENLLRPEPPTFDPQAFTDRGKEMDGWETRRRREPGYDWCVVRLGVPGIVRGVVVDTSFFDGNQPERCSLEATAVEGDELDGAEWFELVGESRLQGDAQNRLWVDPAARATHLRLNVYPDGGVARLRVFGEPLPDLRSAVAGGLTDLASTMAGGTILDASDRSSSFANNLIAPGEARGMQDGWQTKRRRGPGHDWVVVHLAAEAELERVEIDTSFFKGDHPDACSLEVRIAGDDRSWIPALEPQKLGPDAAHGFELEPDTVASYVRLNMHPDGGVARFRVHGRVTDAGWRSWGTRWLNALTPEAFDREVLAGCPSPSWARALREARPFARFGAVLEASDAAVAEVGEPERLAAFGAPEAATGARKGSGRSRRGAKALEVQRQVARSRLEDLVRPRA